MEEGGVRVDGRLRLRMVAAIGAGDVGPSAQSRVPRVIVHEGGEPVHWVCVLLVRVGRRGAARARRNVVRDAAEALEAS